MLSRTADHFYWLSRYMERAENITRFIEVANRLSLSAGGERVAPWQPVLTIAGGEEEFVARFGAPSAGAVIDFAVLDPGNPSSIHSCLRAARENAHAVRSVIPAEIWESINGTWLEARGIDGPRLRDQGLIAFCEWVRERAHQFRGISYGTMLRDEADMFIRLGTALERADNTARLLGVRAAGVQPDRTEVDADDQLHWAAVLRSVSAFRAFRTVHGGDVTPLLAADLLMMQAALPRSLHACLNQVHDLLERFNPEAECARLAGAAHAGIHYGRLDQLLARGLDRFVVDFLETNTRLAQQVHDDFLLG
jgi:uncharacterized alpha-E superfamily protein